MKYLSLLLPLLFLGCSHSYPNVQGSQNDRAPASLGNAHKTVFGHTHKHGDNCGHKKETNGTKTYYLHDGEKHMHHAGHTDHID